MWSDRSALIRSGIVSLGLVVSLVGCGTLMPGGNVGGTGGSGSNSAAPTPGDGPGVTDESVKVVFIATDLTGVESITGFVTEPVGDLTKQAKTLEKWVNDNGGLAGREMEAVVRVYDASTDSVAAEEKLCNQITQDDNAFAVVLTGQYMENARPCYRAAETLMFDAALMASDQKFYEEMAPFLWAPSFPEFTGFVEAHLDVMKEEGFFTDGGLGVVAADNGINKRVYEEVVLPRLEAEGVESKVSWIDSTDIGTLGITLTEAATVFRNAKYENVMFLGGARMASIFDAMAASVQFKARISITSYDNATYFINNPGNLSDPSMRIGMAGIGFHPPQEVTDAAQMPFPNENEQDCFNIYKEAGITWDTREGAKVGLPYCDAIKLLKLGADGMDPSGDFNAWTWSDALKENAADFTPASGFGNGLVDENGEWTGYAGAGAYRVMRFNEESERFEYVSEERSFNDAK